MAGALCATRNVSVRKNSTRNDSAGGVAEVIRAELARRKSSQGDLAEVLSLSQPAIHRRMAGKVAWRVDELNKVAEYLGVPVAEIMAASA